MKNLEKIEQTFESVTIQRKLHTSPQLSKLIESMKEVEDEDDGNTSMKFQFLTRNHYKSDPEIVTVYDKYNNILVPETKISL